MGNTSSVKREDDRNGLQLRQNQHGIRIRGVNNVSRIDLPQADPSGERRRDVAVNDLQFGVVDLRLIGPHRSLKLVGQRFLRIDLLLRNAAGRNQARIALQVQLRIRKLRLVAEQLGLHLVELNLEWPGVDFDQQLSFFDGLPFPEIHLHDLPVDPALDVGGIERCHRAQARQVDRHVLPLHLRGSHRNGTRPGRLRFLLLCIRAAGAAHETCAA